MLGIAIVNGQAIKLVRHSKVCECHSQGHARWSGEENTTVEVVGIWIGVVGACENLSRVHKRL